MEIRNYKPGDEIEIVKLFETVFGKPMSMDYWNWRFRDNPCNQYAIKLMWNEQQLVGHYAVSPVSLDVNGANRTSGLSMTTMTHPDFTGLGVFQQLAESLYKELNEVHQMEAVWGFPNNNSHRGFIKNLGWKDITVIPMMTAAVGDISPKASPSLTPVERFTATHEKAHATLFSNYRVKVRKHEQYLNWRYVDNPSNKYSILEINGGADGFVVLKEFTLSGSKKQLDIIEWCVEDSERMTKTVLQHIAATFPVEEFEKYNIWIPLKDGRHLSFEKFGFSNSLPVTYFGILPFVSADVENEGNWWLQLGDSDVY